MATKQKASYLGIKSNKYGRGEQLILAHESPKNDKTNNINTFESKVVFTGSYRMHKIVI